MIAVYIEGDIRDRLLYREGLSDRSRLQKTSVDFYTERNLRDPLLYRDTSELDSYIDVELRDRILYKECV